MTVEEQGRKSGERSGNEIPWVEFSGTGRREREVGKPCCHMITLLCLPQTSGHEQSTWKSMALAGANMTLMMTGEQEKADGDRIS